MDEVPLRVVFGIAGFAVVLSTPHRISLGLCRSLLELYLRAICFVATGKIHEVLRVRVADDAVEVGADEVGHVGNLEGWDLLCGGIVWFGGLMRRPGKTERRRPGLYRGSSRDHDRACHESRLRCVFTIWARGQFATASCIRALCMISMEVRRRSNTPPLHSPPSLGCPIPYCRKHRSEACIDGSSKFLYVAS